MIRFVMGLDGTRTVVMMSNLGGLQADLDLIRVLRTVPLEPEDETERTLYSLEVKTVTETLFIRYRELTEMETDLWALREKITAPVFDLHEPIGLEPIDSRIHVHEHCVKMINGIDGSIINAMYFLFSHLVSSYRIQSLPGNHASLTITEGSLQYTINDTAPTIEALMRAVQDSQMIAMENLLPC